MSRSAQNETQLTRAILRKVAEKYPEAWVLKTHGSGYQRAGIPDILICLDGRLVAAEIKHQKQGETTQGILSRVTPRQWIELEALREAGAVAEVCWTVEQVLALLEKVAGENLPESS